MKPRTTVILPTYNEAENIVPLIRAILKYIPSDASILVVDDHSPDGTSRVLKHFITSQRLGSRVRCIVRTKNRGLTNSLKEGIAASESAIVIWMDCDFSHPPELIPHLLSTLRRGADIAAASRFIHTKKTNSHDHPTGDWQTQSWLSTGLNTLISRLFGTDLTDYTTGFLAVRRAVLDHIPLQGNYGEYCIDLLVRAKVFGYHIKEIPYRSPPRRYGASKTAPDLATLIRHGYGYIGTLLHLLWTINPAPTTSPSTIRWRLGLWSGHLVPGKTSARANSMKHNIRIRPMDEADIDAVSALHIRTLPTAIARIGNPYLSLLYQQLLRDTSQHVALVATANSQVVGVVTATVDVHKTQQQLQRVLLRPGVLWSICMALLHRRVTVAELVDRMSTEHQIRVQFPHPYASILTFFIDRPYQHHGIGKRLLSALRKKLPRHTKLFVDTELSNKHAQRWYGTHGFLAIKTIGNSVVFSQR